jgi:hypothetical protein
MATDPADMFWQWLVERRTHINEQRKTANDNWRALLKTERAELEVIMATYERMVMNGAGQPYRRTAILSGMRETGGCQD